MADFPGKEASFQTSLLPTFFTNNSNKSFSGGTRRTIHDESLLTVIQIAVTITQGGDSSGKNDGH